jgi:hypothetical protein
MHIHHHCSVSLGALYGCFCDALREYPQVWPGALALQ